jgi:ABC-2 type transport system permease protein
VQTFVQRYRTNTTLPVDLAVRLRLNSALTAFWFGAVRGLIDRVIMLALVLNRAALIRERERGTIEHLLVMPVTLLEIMASKLWAMGLVVLAACALSLVFVVQGLLSVPLAGSLLLFLGGAALHLFATTSLGIFLRTFARTVP